MVSLRANKTPIWPYSRRSNKGRCLRINDRAFSEAQARLSIIYWASEVCHGIRADVSQPVSFWNHLRFGEVLRVYVVFSCLPSAKCGNGKIEYW